MLQVKYYLKKEWNTESIKAKTDALAMEIGLYCDKTLGKDVMEY